MGGLDGRPDLQVQLGPAQPGQARHHGAAHELVGEAVGQAGGRHLLEHPAALGLVERVVLGGRVECRGPGEDVEVELRPGDGGELERVAGRGLEPRQALGHDLPHALGRGHLVERAQDADPAVLDGHRPGLDQHPPQLAEQERVAARERADGLGQRRRRGSGGPGHEGRDLVLAEAGEPQAHDVLGAPQVGQGVGELGRDVGVGVPERGRHEHAHVGRGAGQVAQQEQRRPVGPVAVLEHQEQRLAAAGGGQQLGHRGVQPVTLGVRIGLRRSGQARDPVGQVRQQPGELVAGAAEVGPEGVRVARADEPVERVDERPVRRVDGRVAGPVQDEDALGGRLAGELSHQAALARSRLAAEQRRPATVALEPRQQRTQGAELARPSGEREGRGEAERSWEGLGGEHWSILSIRRVSIRAGRSAHDRQIRA